MNSTTIASSPATAMERSWPNPLDLATAFATQPPPFDFVLPSLMLGTVGALVAPGGVGKSFWALQAAIAVACEVPSADTLKLALSKHGPVAYFSLEDPSEALRHRAHDIGRRLTADARQRVAAHLHVYPLSGHEVDIDDDSTFRNFVKLGAGFRLLVIDTFSRCHRREENSNGDMARVIGTLERLATSTGAAVLLLHHVGKVHEIQASRQYTARGASAIADNGRWSAMLASASSEELALLKAPPNPRADGAFRAGDYVRFSISKGSYGGPASEDLWYRRGNDGVLEPLDVVNQASGTGSQQRRVARRFAGLKAVTDDF